jgi:hypothetical protein
LITVCGLTGAAVAIYDHSGTEITSDQEGYVSYFITPGQSLTFTVHRWDECAQTGTPLSRKHRSAAH